MGQGGHKILGRYLKQGSVTLARVKVTPFNFESLPDAATIYSDNPQKNIIHAALHDEDELKLAIVVPREMATELIDPALKAPIVFPRNFTKDWIEDRKRQKKRGLAHYEDEEDAEQGAQADVDDVRNTALDTDENLGGTAASDQSARTLEREMQASAATELTPGSADPHRGETNRGEHGEQTAFESFAHMQRPGRMTIDDSMSMVGKAIKELSAQDSRSPREAQRGFSAAPDEFIPDDVSSLQSGHGLEEAAIAEYGRQRIAAQVDVLAIKEEAQAQGYEAGFRVGEERATLQYREKVEAIFKNVNGLIHELSGLKRDILDQVQGNFHEISQAMCEALIDRAIYLDPTVFADVLKRAISEAVEGETIKVRVSQKMADTLGKAGLGDQAANIIPDNSLNDDEFRIDSKLGVVDASIHKIIRDLLDQADLNIFDTTSKAG